MTTKQVELIKKKEFTATTLDLEYEVVVVHVAVLSVDLGDEVHLSRRAQIAYLKADKAPSKVSNKYTDFANIFSPKLAAELLEHTGINDRAIELVDNQQPLYGTIYSLGPVKLETLKAYIKNNLVNGFIRPSKSPVGVPILFNKKLDGSLRLYVDYQGLNNLIIKNQYPLPLIEELLNWLSQAQRFIQLNLTNAYYQMRIREGNKWKTGFRACYSHFKYQVILFGLTNDLATFQGYINKILAEKLNVFVRIYLNNIFIYTASESKEHV